MATITRIFVYDKVKAVVRPDTLASMTAFCKNFDGFHLWKLSKTTINILNSVLLMLYKVIEPCGYQDLAKRVHPWYRAKYKAVKRNIQYCREILYRWSKRNIILGDLEDWERNGRIVTLQRKKVNMHLRIDSVDFKFKGIQSF